MIGFFRWLVMGCLLAHDVDPPWRRHGLDPGGTGWIHELHASDPTHHDKAGRYLYWND